LVSQALLEPLDASEEVVDGEAAAQHFVKIVSA
jgi:hypothetical protein